jgi:hypothetical protein
MEALHAIPATANPANVATAANPPAPDPNRNALI